MRDVANTLGTLLKDDVDYRRSIMFVITRFDPEEVDEEYLHQKIQELMNAEKLKLEREHKKRSSQVTLDEKEEVELDKTMATLAILEIMASLPDHVKLVNVFDGISREILTSMFPTLPTIPKESFRFNKVDAVRRNFQEVMTKEIVSVLHELDEFQRLPTEMIGILTQLNERQSARLGYEKQLQEIN